MEKLYNLLSQNLRKHPEKVCIKEGQDCWTYRQIALAGMEFTNRLKHHGVGRGDRVVIFCDNSAEYVAALFGVLGAGAAAVPVNTGRLKGIVSYIVSKCRPGAVATAGRAKTVIESILTSAVLPVLQVPRPSDGDISCMQDEGVDPDDAAMILFTSGTTAYPKGVVLTHASLLANTEAIINYLELNDRDSVLMTLPFTYSYGNSVLLTHMYAGGTIVIENSSVYPLRVLESIKRYRVTGFSTVGSYINLMLGVLRESNFPAGYLESLRYMTFAGESTNIKDIEYLKEEFPHIRPYVMYGQTEASARLSYLPPEHLEEKPGSVGKGLCNVTLRVVDDKGNDVVPGETGEIIASGPSIMKGYFEDPGATRKVIRNGWLHTGDSAVMDGDGFIYVKGRKNDVIKHMGHRIGPVEIENVLNGCRHVTESAAVEATDENGRKIIMAYVVPGEGFNVDLLRRHAQERLPAYMRPSVFEEIDELPRTDTGKIKRGVLRSRQCVELRD